MVPQPSLHRASSRRPLRCPVSPSPVIVVQTPTDSAVTIATGYAAKAFGIQDRDCRGGVSISVVGAGSVLTPNAAAFLASGRLQYPNWSICILRRRFKAPARHY